MVTMYYTRKIIQRMKVIHFLSSRFDIPTSRFQRSKLNFRSPLIHT